MVQTALLIWLALLVVAFLYTRNAKHPATPLLAAYLIFVTAFTAVSFGIFAGLILVAQSAGLTAWLETPLGALVYVIAVFLPGFLVGRLLIKRPPRSAPRL